MNNKIKNKNNLFSYFTYYKFKSILAPLFKMLEAIFELIVPIIMTKIIDIGIANSDKTYIIKMGLVLLLLATVGLICSVTAQYFSASSAVGISSLIRRDLFKHIQSLSYDDIDKLSSSTLITRITSDVNQCQTGINMTLRLLLRSPFIVFGAMIMAFTIDVKLALIFTVLIPILAVVVILIIILTKPLYKKIQSKLDKVIKLVRENLSGNRVIRAFAIEKKEKEKFIQASNELKNEEIKGGILSYLMNPLTYIIINMGIVCLLYFSQVKVNIGEVSQGNVVALYNYMSQILVELVKLANLVVTISKALASKHRIEDVLNTKPSMEYGSYESTPNTWTIEFKDVSFAYNGSDEYSISNISFKATQGETIGIIGPTGSGKATISHLIARFYDATCGSVILNDKNIKEYSLNYLRENISVVLQKSILFNGTIRDNILQGNNNASDEEIYKVLELAQAINVVNKKENKLDELVSEGGKNFSGGERQRLSIARGLISNPNILILDDSTSALDYLTDSIVRQNIKNLENKPITFIISQRCASVMNADKILVMQDGIISGIGTHEELLSNNKDYIEIYNSQTNGGN